MGYGSKDNTIGEWSIEKLRFIEKYLPAFANATKKAWHRYYIDAFAGNGEWFKRESRDTKVEGSVIIALKQIDKFTEQHFIEMNPKRVKNLKRIVSEHKASGKAFIHEGDCNVVLPEIMQKIHKRAPTFVFLDPSGDHLKWESIQHLSEWQTELFILYPWNMTIVRYLKREKNIPEKYIRRLDDFFGTHEWYDIYMNRPRLYLMSELLDLYKKQLNNVGYKYCNVSECFQMPNGPKLYYMIWVGKHPVGKTIMDSIFKTQNDQLTLFDD